MRDIFVTTAINGHRRLHSHHDNYQTRSRMSKRVSKMVASQGELTRNGL
jgi:hypothetical protein